MEPKLGGNRIGDNLRRFDVLLHLDDFIFQIKILKKHSSDTQKPIGSRWIMCMIWEDEMDIQ